MNSELDESWDKSAIAYGQLLLVELVLQAGIERTILDLYLSIGFEIAGWDHVVCYAVSASAKGDTTPDSKARW
ncbi:hypothetical protein ABIB85_004380 [Bradyrhizobium sp. JR1.5]|uniref:hypothetical protein n=1 Tax=unclassified Bradyrhizobium TaxID=2631580 RepID=UPI003396F5FE